MFKTCYGLTTDIFDYEYGHVGTPISTTEIKLVSVNDMNYTIYDKPLPRGEIWIRGNTVFNGYYKNKNKTNSVLFKNGWFATGDVGTWQQNGKNYDCGNMATKLSHIYVTINPLIDGKVIYR